MNKNRKTFLFLGLTLLTLLISVSAASATDNNDTTLSMHDVNTDKIIADSNSKVVQTQQKKEVKTESENKNIKDNKTYKQPKKAVETTQTATDYETLKTSWNNIKNEGDNTTDYIINVKKGNYKFTEELQINTTSNIKSITINGEDTNKTVFDGQNKTRHFNFNSTTIKINFNNITFMGGFNNETGGSIYTKAIVEINNSKFMNNSVVGNASRLYGGAIRAENNITIHNTIFANNSMATTKSSALYGGAISFEGIANSSINIDHSLFTDNTLLGNQDYGATLSLNTRDIFADIINCEFINNQAKRGITYIDNGYYNNITITRCVFNNNGSAYYSTPVYASYNYYNPGSFSKLDLVTSINGKNNFNILNQRNNNATIQLYKYETYYAHPLSDIILGLNKTFNITSSSDLINTTGIILSPSNNYTAVIDISSLPANHEDISLYMDGVEVAKVVYNYTNIEFNNITTKAGNTVNIKAKLTSNNKEIIQNGKVAFKINGKTIGHANVNIGVASIKYIIPENYSAKDYILTVVYGGSRNFIEARSNATLKLEKLETKTDVKTEITNNTLKININPIDENNKTVSCGKVCVKINGKTQKTYTINGKSTYNFTIPKSWNNRDVKVLVIYGENKNYKSSRCELTTKVTYTAVKSPVKEVKKDDIVNNYYVSDATGSDTNTGSSDNPFKTIQKAITTLQNNGQTANIYLDGNFKGVGNTNLTIPGDLKINFIGIGNSSIDGEVNYTGNTGDGYYWGSSAVWKPYQNGKGNWAMNITRGSGLITISNFTIKNCWNPGGSNINAYPTATVNNYGNLEVYNVTFRYNHGGVGASIRNKVGATLKVVDSLFEGNRKSSSTGNFGAGIYNNGTAVVINSTFQHNYARWGTITNDKNLTIINSTIRDNIGYDGGSTFKTGSGIAINTGRSDFFDGYDIDSIVTIIDGCTFINNDQLDISADEGNLNVTNCVFNKSTGIVVPTRYKNKTNPNSYNFINNTIDSPQGSTLQTSLSSSSLTKYAFRLGKGPYVYLIENNTGINLTCYAIDGEASNSTIRGNIFDNSTRISGSNNLYEKNNITTKKDYSIELDGRNNTVVDNHLISSQFEGNGAVLYTDESNVVSNNTPKMSIIRLNDENFYQYFDDDGNLRAEYEYIDQITLITGINNKVMVFNTTLKLGQKTKRLLSNNTTIIINDNGCINATGISILNTNNEPVFILNSDNNIITNANLTTNHTNTIIINNNKNNTITGSTLLADILVGDESVANKGVENNILSNKPTYKNYVIDDTTYNTYFNANGTIKELPADTPIRLLIGELNNKTLILNNNHKNITLMNYHDIIAHNITIKTEANTTLNMTHITIENTNNKPVVEIRAPNNKIRNTSLTSNTNVILVENTQDTRIEYNNITSNTTDDIKTIKIENTTNTQLNRNNITVVSNITKDNKTHTIIAVENINSTDSDSKYNNIIITNLNEIDDNIYAFNMINPELYNTTQRNEVQGNTIAIVGFNNVCAINMINQSLYVQDNKITTHAKNTVAIKATTSNAYISYQNGGVTSNTINTTSYLNNTGIILDSCENVTIRSTVRFNLEGENITGIKLLNTTNITVFNMTMDLKGNDITAIDITKTSKTNITSNNITINAKNEDKKAIIFNNTEETIVTNNTIMTTAKYTINVDKKSSKSNIQDNLLYALNLGDSSVIDESNNYIRITNNKPTVSYLNLLLNDNTYSAFFDENGVLRDEIPTSANITVVGNIYDKTINITRPVNIMTQIAGFINTTVIISPTAKNTNITGIYMKGHDNTKLIIQADSCNITIPKISMQNKENKNITLITIKGNYNKINITSIETNNEEVTDVNMTQLYLSGKQNNITIKSMETNTRGIIFNNLTAVIVENAKTNKINISTIRADQGVILHNSNANHIIINDTISMNHVGIQLINSSNNIIYQATFLNRNNLPGIRVLIVENNSNNNKLFGIGTNQFNSYDNSPVLIKNSNNNTLEGGDIRFKGELYPIEIINGFENEVKHNLLKSTNYSANHGVYQETNSDDEKQNNKVYENVDGEIPYKGLYTINLYNIKPHQTINITVGNSAIGTKGGNYTLFINGKQIAKATAQTSSVTVNYTVTGEEGEEAILTVLYQSTYVVITSTKIQINKLESNIILPNVTSTNGQTTLSAIVLDEEGNIQTNGKVAFKVNGKTIETVKIQNGIAQTTFDSSKYNAKEYNITAIYGGNQITAKSTTNSTLTITKTTPKIQVENSNVKRSNNTTITVKLVDENGNNIASNTKIAVKLNGKTIQHTKSTNGILSLNLDLTQYKNSKYNLTIISGENSCYNKATIDTDLIIE